MQIFENLGCAEVVCATMATERLLITGDKSTVVRVWEIPTVKDRNKTMALVKVNIYPAICAPKYVTF